MRSAYNETWLHNLEVVKESKTWFKASMIDEGQFKAISEAYVASFYHPNFIIRMLIFIASLIGLSGVTGLLALILDSTDETVLSIAAIVYGVGSFVFLDKVIVANKKHYKSGVTEALLYHACGFTIGGFIGLVDVAILPSLIAGAIVLSYAAYRYLDLLTTALAFFTLAYLIFFQFFDFGGIFQQIIPFAFILSFTPLFFLSKRLKANGNHSIWKNNLLLIESLSLLMIYLAGNYLVVRELSVNMMDLSLAEGEDIPFAFLFYGFTILFPIAYVYFGIKNKDLVLLRISLLVLAFSVFTFKFYYGLNRPEISLTIAGLLLLGISLALFNYLKIMRSGFTRENLISEKWTSMNAEAFIISQTMGGNQVSVDDSFQGKGGEFGGGGSSGDF